MSTRDVERTDGGEWALAAALALAGVGIAIGSPVIVAAATLPLWYVAAAVLGSRRSAMVRIERELDVSDDEGSSFEGGDDDRSGDDDDRSAGDGGDRSDAEAVGGDPGETVTVRTTVQNVGSETIVDLRLVDGVPLELPVVSGTARSCVTLEPLEKTVLEYDVALRRGEHAFDEPTVRTRDLTGTVAETWTVDALGDAVVRCSPTVDRVPLGGGTNDYAGEVPTDEGGTGVEFYSVREYEPGDQIGSIDWRRYAGTRELATVEYRAERATRIVCVVDARGSQFGAATTEDRPAVARSADAAERTFEALVDAGHPTGVVGLYDRSLDVVPPGTDPATRERVRRVVKTAREANPGVGSGDRTRSDDPIAELSGSLPGESQVYLFSSFVDDDPLKLVERLRTVGYPVRVVSPDVTDADDVATRLLALDRDNRLARVRATGARVVDWKVDRSLRLVLRDAVGEVKGR